MRCHPTVTDIEGNREARARSTPDLQNGELTKVVVSEAGASVYSASAFASQELPDLARISQTG